MGAQALKKIQIMGNLSNQKIRFPGDKEVEIWNKPEYHQCLQGHFKPQQNEKEIRYPQDGIFF